MLPVFLVISMSSCATPQQRRESLAWSTICASTPNRAGDRYTIEEMRAMTVVGAWALSVEQVNETCAKRR